jgi:hypothetical protein
MRLKRIKQGTGYRGAHREKGLHFNGIVRKSHSKETLDQI